MPKQFGFFERGRVDILNLAGVGFLTLSLVAVVSVTSNPKIKQIFAPKAVNVEYSTPPETVPVVPVTIDPEKIGFTLEEIINTANHTPNTTGFDCRQGGCGGGAGAVSGYYQAPNGLYYAIGGTGNDPRTYASTSLATVIANGGKVPSSQPTTTTTKTTGGFTRDQVVNTKAGVNSTGYDCSKGGCASGVDVSGYYLQNGKYYPIGGTGNNPNTYKKDSLAQKIADAQEYLRKTAAALTATQNTEKQKELEKEAIAFSEANKALIQVNQQGGISIKNQEGGECEFNSDCGSGSCNGGKCKSGIPGGDSLAIVKTLTTPTALINQTDTSSSSDCSTGYMDSGICAPDLGENTYQPITAQSVYNSLNTISGGIFGDYVKYYQKVAAENPDANYATQMATGISNTEGIYKVVNLASFGTFENYIKTYQKAATDNPIDTNDNFLKQASTYLQQSFSKEGVAASSAFGTTMVTEAAAIVALPVAITAGTTVAAGGGGALAVLQAAGGSAMVSLGQISTMSQTIDAANAHYQDPGSKEAWHKTELAALSWGNLGTNALLAKGSSVALPFTNIAVSTKAINTAMSLVNVAVDAPEAYDTCTKKGSSLDCGGAITAVVADIGGGFLDYKQGQLGLGNPLSKVSEADTKVIHISNLVPKKPTQIVGDSNTIATDIAKNINPEETRFATPEEIDLITKFSQKTDVTNNIDVADQLTPPRPEFSNETKLSTEIDQSLANTPEKSIALDTTDTTTSKPDDLLKQVIPERIVPSESEDLTPTNLLNLADTSLSDVDKTNIALLVDTPTSAHTDTPISKSIAEAPNPQAPPKPNAEADTPVTQTAVSETKPAPSIGWKGFTDENGKLQFPIGKRETFVNSENGNVYTKVKSITQTSGSALSQISTATDKNGQEVVVKIFNNIEGPIGKQMEISNASQIEILKNNSLSNPESSVLPKYVDTIKDKNGKTIGYVMEKIDGVSVGDLYKSQGNRLTNEQLDQIDNALQTYYRETGLMHGDIISGTDKNTFHSGNIIFTGDPKRPVVIIDPSPDNTKFFGMPMNKDDEQNMVAEIIEKLKNKNITNGSPENKIPSLTNNAVSTPTKDNSNIGNQIANWWNNNIKDDQGWLPKLRTSTETKTNIKPTTISENITPTSEDISQTFDPNLGYSDISESPLFVKDSRFPDNARLNVKGSTQSLDKVKQDIENLCVLLPAACRQNALSAAYHGSSSTSLFNTLSGEQMAIEPLSDLISSGKPVFSASNMYEYLDPGTVGLENVISTSAIHPDSAVEYARGVSWSEKGAKDKIDILSAEYSKRNKESTDRINNLKIPSEDKQAALEIYNTLLTSNDKSITDSALDKYYALGEKYDDSILSEITLSLRDASHLKNNVQRTITYLNNQIKTYPTLAPWQKDLVDNSFPVVYGIKPDNNHASVFIPSDISNEIGFRGGLNITEVQNIFIPKSEIPRVEKIWSDLHPGMEMPFKLQDIDLLSPTSSLNESLSATKSISGSIPQITEEKTSTNFVKRATDYLEEKIVKPINNILPGGPSKTPTSDVKTMPQKSSKNSSTIGKLGITGVVALSGKIVVDNWNNISQTASDLWQSLPFNAKPTSSPDSQTPEEDITQPMLPNVNQPSESSTVPTSPSVPPLTEITIEQPQLQTQQQKSTTSRVVILGDSITQGYLSDSLYEQLKAAGYDIELLGNQKSVTGGTTTEGHSGYSTAAIVNSLKAQKWLYDKNTSQVEFDKGMDVVVLQLGVNDLVNKNSIDNTTIPNMRYIVNYLRDINPNVKIVITSVPKFYYKDTDYTMDVNKLNIKFAELASQVSTSDSPVIMGESFASDYDPSAYTSDGIHPYKVGADKIAESIVNTIKNNQVITKQEISSKPVDDSSLNNFNVYLQRNNNVINKAGDTMLTKGCGPSTAYNILQLTGHDVSINKVVDNFYWVCTNGTCGTGADAVLLSLQQNGFTNAVSSGKANRITDANALKNYTGLLVYGGTVSSPTENIVHLAGFNCNNGNCVSIDSYFSDGKPVGCNIEGSSSIKCGNYTYHVGATGGTPDALYPVAKL